MKVGKALHRWEKRQNSKPAGKRLSRSEYIRFKPIYKTQNRDKKTTL
jgi:hypothetical protein